MVNWRDTLYVFWAIKLVAVLFICVAATMVFNYLFDPFLKGNFHLVQYNRAEIHRRVHVPLWTLLESAKIPLSSKKDVSIVILGDSRSRMLTGGYKTNRLKRWGDEVVYNMSIGGARLNEAVSFYNKEKAFLGLENVKVVVFAVPFISLCKKNNVDRVDEALGILPFYYLHLYVTKRSLLSFFYAKWKLGVTNDRLNYEKESLEQLELQERWAEQTSLDRVNRESVGVKKNRVKKQTRRFRNHVKTGYKFIEKNLADVLEFLQFLDSNGVEVVVWNPPVTDNVVEMIDRLDYKEKYKIYSDTLGSVGRFYDFVDNKYEYNIDYKFLQDIVHSENSAEILSIILFDNETKGSSLRNIGAAPE